MNEYYAYFDSKVIKVYADTLYDAKLKGAAELKVPKKKMGLLGIVLNKVGERQVVHTPDF